MKRFNITLQELEDAAKFARENGETVHKTITMHIDSSSGIGEGISISAPWNGEKHNITNIDSW